MYSVCKEFSFDAAHRLHSLEYVSKCKNLHGHKYFITLRLYNDKLNECDMILDFTHFKLFQKFLDDQLDHSILISEDDQQLLDIAKQLDNRYFVFKGCKLTTSENIAKYLFEIAKTFYFGLTTEIEVTVHETPKNFASFRGDSK